MRNDFFHSVDRLRREYFVAVLRDEFCRFAVFLFWAAFWAAVYRTTAAFWFRSPSDSFYLIDVPFFGFFSATISRVALSGINVLRSVKSRAETLRFLARLNENESGLLAGAFEFSSRRSPLNPFSVRRSEVASPLELKTIELASIWLETNGRSAFQKGMGKRFLNGSVWGKTAIPILASVVLWTLFPNCFDWIESRRNFQGGESFFSAENDSEPVPVRSDDGELQNGESSESVDWETTVETRSDFSDDLFVESKRIEAALNEIVRLIKSQLERFQFIRKQASSRNVRTLLDGQKTLFDRIYQNDDGLINQGKYLARKCNDKKYIQEIYYIVLKNEAINLLNELENDETIELVSENLGILFRDDTKEPSSIGDATETLWNAQLNLFQEYQERFALLNRIATLRKQKEELIAARRENLRAVVALLRLFPGTSSSKISKNDREQYYQTAKKENELIKKIGNWITSVHNFQDDGLLKLIENESVRFERQQSLENREAVDFISFAKTGDETVRSQIQIPDLILENRLGQAAARQQNGLDFFNEIRNRRFNDLDPFLASAIFGRKLDENSNEFGSQDGFSDFESSTPLSACSDVLDSFVSLKSTRSEKSASDSSSSDAVQTAETSFQSDASIDRSTAKIETTSNVRPSETSGMGTASAEDSSESDFAKISKHWGELPDGDSEERRDLPDFRPLPEYEAAIRQYFRRLQER